VKILLDMNLSPQWRAALERQGHAAVHWMDVGDPRAPDEELLAWAAANDRVVLTHDLDFGAILAATAASGPSVLQLRAQDVLPSAMERYVLEALRAHEHELEAGALLVVEPARRRVRVLPMRA